MYVAPSVAWGGISCVATGQILPSGYWVIFLSTGINNATIRPLVKNKVQGLTSLDRKSHFPVSSNLISCTLLQWSFPFFTLVCSRCCLLVDWQPSGKRVGYFFALLLHPGSKQLFLSIRPKGSQTKSLLKTPFHQLMTFAVE